MAQRVETVCLACGRPFAYVRNPHGKKQVFCSPTCAKNGRKGAKLDANSAQNVSVPEFFVEKCLRRELEEAGKLDSAVGQALCVLANRIDQNRDGGQSLSSLVHELRDGISALLGDQSQVLDLVDELRARRERKLGATAGSPKV